MKKKLFLALLILIVVISLSTSANPTLAQEATATPRPTFGPTCTPSPLPAGGPTPTPVIPVTAGSPVLTLSVFILGAIFLFGGLGVFSLLTSAKKLR